MEESDVSAVAELYKRYMERFDMIPLLEEDEVRHQFLSGRGRGEREASGRRQGQVVWTYVVEVSSHHDSRLPLVAYHNGLESGITRDHRFLLVLHIAVDNRVQPAA